MTSLARLIRSVAARAGLGPTKGALDEFQSEKWSRLHKGNAYFIRVDDGSDDICDMLRRRTASGGNVISEINRTHMADANTLRGKAVMEIGFGGGWYLAQALKEGARSVCGFEAADNIVRATSSAFDRLGIGPYKFYRVDKRYLDALPRGSVDVAFSKTVFQHINPRATAAYLRTVPGALKSNGYCLFQFLMNEDNPARDSNVPDDEGEVSYTKAEVDAMVSRAGLHTLAYAETWRDAGTGNYWAWYKLAKAAPSDLGRLAGGGGGSCAGDIGHIRGLIPPSARSVLAVGCGAGSHGEGTDMLREVCRSGQYRVTGIDASAGRISERKKNGPPGEYRAMDAMDAHTLGKKFDVVICRHVLERLPEGDGRKLLGQLEGMHSRLLVASMKLGPAGRGSGGARQGREGEVVGGGNGIPHAWYIDELRAERYYIRQNLDHLIAFRTTESMPGGAHSTERELEQIRRTRQQGGRPGRGGGGPE